MVGLRPVVAPTQDDFANTLSDQDRSNLDRRARADPGRSPREDREPQHAITLTDGPQIHPE
jgi:hypothetical protein